MAISPQRITDPLHGWIQVAFSGSTLFPVRLNPGWQPAAIMENYSGIAVSLRLHGFLVSCTSFLHAIEHSSIPAQKLSGM